jgi:hypothetical protein
VFVNVSLCVCLCLCVCVCVCGGEGLQACGAGWRTRTADRRARMSLPGPLCAQFRHPIKRQATATLPLWTRTVRHPFRSLHRLSVSLHGHVGLRIRLYFFLSLSLCAKGKGTGGGGLAYAYTHMRVCAVARSGNALYNYGQLSGPHSHRSPTRSSVCLSVCVSVCVCVCVSICMCCVCVCVCAWWRRQMTCCRVRRHAATVYTARRSSRSWAPTRTRPSSPLLSACVVPLASLVSWLPLVCASALTRDVALSRSPCRCRSRRRCRPWVPSSICP